MINQYVILLVLFSALAFCLLFAAYRMPIKSLQRQGYKIDAPARKKMREGFLLSVVVAATIIFVLGFIVVCFGMGRGT